MQIAEATVVEQIQKQRKIRENLNARLVKARTTQEHYLAEFDRCGAQALELFGTKELSELRTLLAKNREENDKMLAMQEKEMLEVSAVLTGIESVLEELQAL